MKIYIMCGLPGSGKSTKAKELVNDNTIIVNKDSIRQMLFGSYDYKPKFENLVKDTVEEIIMLCVDYNTSFIIDETNIKKEKRKQLVFLINQLVDINTTNITDIVFIYCSENKNNLEYRMKEPKTQSRKIWEKVITSMKKDFEKPTIKEMNKYKKLYPKINFELEEYIII